jgi:4-hydroxy-3-polyprenylbenzoate decarboxylase
MRKKKIVIGITGASGAIYAKNLLSKLENLKAQLDVCNVVFSDYGKRVWQYELPKDDISNIPFKVYENDDLFAPFASGSSAYDTMIICPCTVGTMGRIASGVANDLIGRSADVILKERKKLILVLRELPLNLIHINNMKTITEAGGIICPASPSFYSHPETIDALVDTVINRVLELADIDIESYRWSGG